MQHSLHKIVSKVCIFPCGKPVHVAGDSLVVKNSVPTFFCIASVNWWQVSQLNIFYNVPLLPDNELNLAGHKFGQEEKGLLNILDNTCLKNHI